MMYIRILAIFSLFLLSACGSSGSNDLTDAGDNSGGTSQTSLPIDISGLLVFEKHYQKNLGVFTLELSNGNIIKTRTFSGQFPYAHDRETIVFSEECGSYTIHQIKIITEEGLASAPISPCTSEILKNGEDERNYGASYEPISVSKLSPDKTKLAVEIEWYYTNYTLLHPQYSVIIFDVNTQAEIKRYDNYGHPEWHPDGRLLITPYGDKTTETGIFMVDKDFAGLTRVDQNQINQKIAYTDISPSGRQVAFTMGDQIWVMDINGDNLNELISGNARLAHATWSPDEKFIAFLHQNAMSYDRKISFINLKLKELYELNTKPFLTTSDPLEYVTPRGPLSWVE